jgi:hypothetical protein
MLIINTAADLPAAAPSAERTAFLTALLNDYITFDDAAYPEGYGQMQLQPGDSGYITPILRKEWNAGAAKQWGFDTREAIQNALA